MKDGKDTFCSQLQIKDVIRKVQEELIESQKERERKGMPALFEVESLELELHFVVQKSTQTGSDVTLAVIEGGYHSNISSEQIQKITLKLKTTRSCDEKFQPPVYEDGFLPDEEGN